MSENEYRFRVRIPTTAPVADAKRLDEYLRRYEYRLASIAYARGELAERRWWQSGEGAELSRPACCSALTCHGFAASSSTGS
jgi:hypothetical protein